MVQYDIPEAIVSHTDSGGKITAIVISCSILLHVAVFLLHWDDWRL